MKTVQSHIIEMREKFKSAGLDTPELDARLLVQGAVGMGHEDLLININVLITDSQSEKITEFTERRLRREPVSRILGTRAFWRSDFKVSHETLDPRADSETLVEAVMKYTDKGAPLTILDLGTGTGCLLLSLLQELPQATGVGLDISADAIRTAEENARNLNLSSRVEFLEGDWSKVKFGSPFDIVISNPPYISDDEIKTLAPEVRQYDPHRALSGGADGLDCYRSISAMLPKLLKKSGNVFLEIGSTQAAAVREVLAEKQFYVVETFPDLAGHDRCLVAECLNVVEHN